MKKLIGLSVASAAAFALASCGESADVALLMSNSSNEFFSVLEDAFVEQIETDGHTVEVFDAANDSTKQTSQVEDAIAKGVKAIVINPLSASDTTAVLNDAIDAGIIVISVDATVDGVDFYAQIATDNYDGGVFVSEWCDDRFPDGNGVENIVHLRGVAGHSASIGRGDGFVDGLTEMPAWDSLRETKTTEIANFDQTQGQDKMEGILATNKIVAGDDKKTIIYAENDVMALGAINAIEANSKYSLLDFVIVGFDGSADAKSAIDSGKMAATVVQDFEFMGTYAAEILHDKWENNVDPTENNVSIDVYMYPSSQDPRA